MLAGVNGTDPFRLMERFLDELKALGFAGVQNFPTVGLIDGVFRQNLEETGMGYGLEVDMIALARERDLLTAPTSSTPDQAAAMAQAGADIIVPHMGLTTGGAIGAQTALTLDDARRPGAGACATRPAGQPGHHRPVPRRPDRRARRRRLRAGAHRTASAASSAPRRWNGCRPSARSRPR